MNRAPNLAKTERQKGFFNFFVALLVAAFFVVFLGGITARKYLPGPSPSPTPFEKESDPAKVITDAKGVKLVVNEIVILVKDDATDSQVKEIANLIDGVITGFIPIPKIYKIEVKTSLPSELYNKIQTIKNLNKYFVIDVIPNLVSQ